MMSPSDSHFQVLYQFFQSLLGAGRPRARLSPTSGFEIDWPHAPPDCLHFPLYGDDAGHWFVSGAFSRASL